MNSLLIRGFGIAALSFVLSACASKSVLVYEAKGDKQCEQGGLSMEQSKGKLSNADIAVSKSFCGRKTGLSMMTMCGGPTSNILLHHIDNGDVDRALALGFYDIDTLSNRADKGYEIVPCQAPSRR